MTKKYIIYWKPFELWLGLERVDMSRTVREQEQKVFNTLQNYVPQEMTIRITNVKRNLFFTRLTYDVIEKADFYPHNILSTGYHKSNISR